MDYLPLIEMRKKIGTRMESEDIPGVSEVFDDVETYFGTEPFWIRFRTRHL